MLRMITWLRKHSSLLGNIGLVVVMLVGLAYIGFGALSWRPWQGSYHLTVNFPISGGLQDSSRVTLRGVNIGKVESLQVQPQSVQANLTIDDDVKINRNSLVSALGLSAAGEQYVDFTPTTSSGPYFTDGDTIEVNQTHVTAPFPALLESSLNVISQIDPVKLRATVSSLDTALTPEAGQTNQLRVFFDAAGTVFTDLRRVLPETTKLIQQTGTILATTADVQPDFGTTTAGASAVINSAVAANGELNTLLGKGPAQFTSLSGSLSQIRDPLTGVLQQVADIARQGALRAPALATLLPSIRDASYISQDMFHDGAWWVMASIFPRPYCNYAVTPIRPTKVLETVIPTNLYCVTEDKNQQIRGSANAPRPPGDDTAGPALGADPNARTVPLG
ncbi:MlaD family protein [Gordonia sp. 852002-51296_SCH5728562-b]|uniref:MlaD family protein n=1 Tax=Gordonia sp. 852002-51296_SCH5728562-b TaxID=1834101 RepID=UPI0007EBD9D6|nr:MlaD family protein [Gordonia sp. 852002-51296_SCH5728562-b]OBA43844.1 virulence factor Mce [Gordonia sp. 852002-51296_SCH5728562-b]